MSSATIEKPNRQVRRKEQTRTKLLQAASQAFLEKGVDETTASDITELADIAYGSFYNYFKSVPEIVPVVVEEILKEHHQAARELQENHDDPSMRIAIGINALFKSVMSAPAITWLTQKPDIMADELARIVSADAMDDIRLGVESGDFILPCDNITLQAFCVWGITGVLKEISRTPEQLQHFTENMIQIYLRILGVEDSKIREIIKYCPTSSN